MPETHNPETTREMRDETMTIFDVVQKLIGPIQPIGDMYVDDQRYKNLHEMTKLIDNLLFEIGRVAVDKDRTEHSIRRAGKHAAAFLHAVKETES